MQFQAEFEAAQFEVAIGPLLPMEAVDALAYSQEAIRSIAFVHDVDTTSHPKPFLQRTEKWPPHAFLSGII